MLSVIGYVFIALGFLILLFVIFANSKIGRKIHYQAEMQLRQLEKERNEKNNNKRMEDLK